MSNFSIIEKEQDLFLVDTEKYVIAHCISADCAFGEGSTGHYGIAWDMQCHFEGIKEACRRQNPMVGKALEYISHKGAVLNLVTKNNHWEKPTYDSLRLALVDMKIKMIEHNAQYVAMPRIGSGLDRLQWRQVKEIIVSLFKDTDINILICIKPT